MRTILEMEHGVASDSITWVTQEGPHVAEASEPSNVLRDASGAGPAELLANGRVDAAIFGNDLPADPWIGPLIEDAEAKARTSFAHSRVAPINHIVAVTRDLAERHPDIVQYIYRTFVACQLRVFAHEQRSLHPVGFAAMGDSVDVLLQHAAAQRLTTRRLTFDELFGDASRLLATAA